MKVYGYRGWRTECPPAPNGTKQTREIVAAPSAAAAARALGVTVYLLKRNGSETGNPEEVALASSKPGTVFWTPLNGHRGQGNAWVEVTPREDA